MLKESVAQQSDDSICPILVEKWSSKDRGRFNRACSSSVPQHMARQTFFPGIAGSSKMLKGGTHVSHFWSRLKSFQKKWGSGLANSPVGHLIFPWTRCQFRGKEAFLLSFLVREVNTVFSVRTAGWNTYKNLMRLCPAKASFLQGPLKWLRLWHCASI